MLLEEVKGVGFGSGGSSGGRGGDGVSGGGCWGGDREGERSVGVDGDGGGRLEEE